MTWVYLACLLVSLSGMVLLDLRWRLFLFARPLRGLLTLMAGLLLFLLADIVSIARGFYGRGQSPALSGIEISPHLPVEEIVFIVFLCYLTMVLHGLVTRFVLPPTGERRARR